MLDTKVSNNQKYEFNSISGTLVKSTEKSKFVRCHVTSNLAKYIFDTDMPRLDEEVYKAKEITVLQVMLCSGDYFLIEYTDLNK